MTSDEMLRPKLTREQERLSYFENHQFPRWCYFDELFEDENGELESDFCEKPMKFIVHVERVDSRDKAKWDYYDGFCPEHFKRGLKHSGEPSNQWIHAKILDVWRITAVRIPPRTKLRGILLDEKSRCPQGEPCGSIV